ncbi:MAG: hypothetical protein GX945_13530 [Lentisphaerae bacterium]|jgi:uncharacterized lipoprotein YmbA|nr:hypothetical protein [Lentisphaerota bacterium]
MKMPPVLMLMASLSFLGCTHSTPTRYYLLSVARELQPLPSASSAPVMLRQLRLPEYLDRTEIVRRRSVNELGISDNHLWGEKLGVATATTLERNLAQLLGDKTLLFAGRHSVPANCRCLNVVLHQFEADADNVFNADGYCYLEKANGAELSLLLRVSHSQPLADDSVGALVDAYNDALADIAKQIAAALTALP